MNLAFRQHLQDELLKRAKKNARFSIRAFARQLELEPSSLAQILNGKRKLTFKMCERLSLKLGISPSKLVALMKAEAPRVTHFDRFNKINEDAFRTIADWHNFAILELTRTDGFKGNINWIARVLGITTAEAHTAVERLKRLNYLSVDTEGRWKDSLSSAVNSGNEYSTPAFREHQKQILTKAVEALENVPYDERVQSSMMLVGSRERVTEAKRRILNFIEELDEYMKNGDTHDEVYSISVSLFPLSKIKLKKIRSKL